MTDNYIYLKIFPKMDEKDDGKNCILFFLNGLIYRAERNSGKLG